MDIVAKLTRMLGEGELSQENYNILVSMLCGYEKKKVAGDCANYESCVEGEYIKGYTGAVNACFDALNGIYELACENVLRPSCDEFCNGVKECIDALGRLVEQLKEQK